MKKTLLALALSVLSTSAIAGSAVDNPARAIKVKNKIRHTVLQMEGVAGIGVPKCNPETGMAKPSVNAVSCVAIYVEDYEAFQALLGLYPNGTKIDGIIVTVVPTGELKFDPRISAGN